MGCLHVRFPSSPLLQRKFAIFFIPTFSAQFVLISTICRIICTGTVSEEFEKHNGGRRNISPTLKWPNINFFEQFYFRKFVLNYTAGPLVVS